MQFAGFIGHLSGEVVTFGKIVFQVIQFESPLFEKFDQLVISLSNDSTRSGTPGSAVLIGLQITGKMPVKSTSIQPTGTPGFQ